jgi:hypothetical protein
VLITYVILIIGIYSGQLVLNGDMYQGFLHIDRRNDFQILEIINSEIGLRISLMILRPQFTVTQT